MEDIERVLFERERIAEAVKAVAIKLDKHFSSCERSPLAVGILKGAAMFFCDLVREMETPLELDFMTLASYGSGTRSGEVKRLSDTSASVKDRDVLVVEDIVDSGNTLFKLKEILLGRGARSFTSVALLDKPSRRIKDIAADHSCFTVGDDFVVGYGLDYAGRYRDLPYIGVLKRSVYEEK